MHDLQFADGMLARLRAKGGERYVDYVEPSFTSMFAAAGTAGAKDLVDRSGRRLPFLDPNKKPLT